MKKASFPQHVFWLGKTFLVLLLCGGSYEASAQLIQVVTKTVERTFAFRSSDRLVINAQNADIELTTWDRPEIKIVLELTARHTERSVAQTDLDVMRYVADKNGSTVTLLNTVVLKANQVKPESNLRARYVVTVPANCPINVQNSFGRTTLSGLEKATRVSTEFGQTKLVGLRGTLSTDTRFGELSILDFAGKLDLTAERTTVLVQAQEGTCRIRTKYGILDIRADKKLVDITLQTQQTELRKDAVTFNTN